MAASVLRNARSIGSRPDLSTRIDHEEVSARRRRWIGQVDIEVAAEPGIRSAASLSLSHSRPGRVASPLLATLASERRYHIGEDERPAECINL